MNPYQLQPPSPARIFVSSTSFDLASVREELSTFLTGHGYEPLLFESSSAFQSLNGPESALQHAVHCDICILIVGARYGSRAQESDISYTHAEYRAAMDAGKPIYAFIQYDTLIKFDMYNVRSDENFWTEEESDLFRFIKEVSEKRTRFPFATLPELKKIILFQLASYYGYLLRNYAELDIFSPKTSNQWLVLGNRYWDSSQFGQAIFCYREGASADEGSDSLELSDAVTCMGNLSRALRITGRQEESLKTVEEAIIRYPNAIRLHILRTTSLVELGRIDEALEIGRECATMFPDDYRSWDILRYVYDRLNNHDMAIEVIEKAVEIEPDNLTLKSRLQDHKNFRRTKPTD